MSFWKNLVSTGLATLLLTRAAPLLAHDSEALQVSLPWTFDAWIVIPLLLSGALYALGVLRLSRRILLGQRRLGGQAAAYAFGWLALAGALLSPLHWLGEHLFTAHMVEHEIVMAIAAPLLVLSRPAAPLLWALRDTYRRFIGDRVARTPGLAIWRVLTRPSVATILHGLAIWLWHIPPFFDAALVNVSLHRLQHVSFLATAILFWWSLLRRSSYGVAAWDLFFTMIHTTLLGVLMALAPRVLYGMQTADAPIWGLTPLEDQQLAGIIMWVPAGTIYAGAALAFIATWIRTAGKGWSAPTVSSP